MQPIATRNNSISNYLQCSNENGFKWRKFKFKTTALAYETAQFSFSSRRNYFEFIPKTKSNEKVECDANRMLGNLWSIDCDGIDSQST